MISLRPTAFACASLLACMAVAGDWPTYRFDAARSACTPDALPAKLALRWSQRLPSYDVAFPNEERQQFDTSYEPVCADGILVVGSPADGSVRAYDAESGEELWRFHADGPVRLAPVLHEGRVLFGADDGRFRCLDLKTGALLWERRAFPEERPDVRLLGNNRLISLWPVRGGAVVVGDTVFLGSGVWPTMGVSVQALDVRTGEPRWTNARLGHLTDVRIDHNLRYDAGVSPQGYLLVHGERLIVANGRSHPVALNRADGSLFHFVQGYRNGHCRVVLGGNYAFVGTSGVLSLVDFREVGNKWLAAGKDAPEVFDARKFDLYEGPYHPYKKFPGCDADSVFDGETAYSLANGILYAHTLGDSGVSEYPLEQGGRALAPFRWDARMTLRAATGLGGSTRLFAKAANTLYGRAGNRVVALRMTDAQPPVQLAWDAKVEALPTSMIAAQDRLVVALADGSLLCFAADGQPAADLTVKAEVTSPASTSDLEALLAAKTSRAGFAVVLGGLDAGETECLLANTDLRVFVAGGGPEETERERRRLARAGVYGRRIERLGGDPLGLRLPPYLASVLWLRGRALGAPSPDALARLWNSVRPHGGSLCFTGDAPQCARFATLAARLPGARVQGGEGWVRADRPDGLPGAADWTHETADAARSFFSQDRAVRAPLAPLWYGDGPGYGFVKSKDYGRGVKPQVVEGRVFALEQRSATLYAYDAYTGRVLWSARGEGQEKGFITRFASLPDGIYAAGRGLCAVYDPATGKELRRMRFHGAAGENKPARAAAVVVSEDSILVAVSAIETVAIEGGLWDADALVCFDRQSGAHRWRRAAAERFNTKALAIGGGGVFCTDSLSPVAADAFRRRGQERAECASTVLALDERTGTERWRYRYQAPYRAYGADNWMSVRSRDDWLAYCASGGRILAGRHEVTVLLDAAAGKPVWEKPIGLSQPVVLMGDRVLDQGGRIVRLETGETEKGNVFRRGGCNYAVANAFLAFVRDQTVCYVDLASGVRYRLRNLRSGCSNSLVAASGVLSIPNFSAGCVCNYPVQTSSSWVHDPEVATWDSGESLALRPVMADPGIPRLDPAAVAEMHAFRRRFLADDPAAAAAHLLAHWGFEGAAEEIPCRLTNPAFEPFGQGQALRCGGLDAKTQGHGELMPAGRIQDALTLAAWIRLGDTQHKGAAGIVECPQIYRLMVGETEPPYSVSISVQTEGGWRSASSPRTIQPGQWVHVAGTYDAEVGECVLYLDGKAVRTSMAAPARVKPVSGSVAVGVRDGSAYLTGAIDEVRVYDRALGPKAIAPLAARP